MNSACWAALALPILAVTASCELEGPAPSDPGASGGSGGSAGGSAGSGTAGTMSMAGTGNGGGAGGGSAGTSATTGGAGGAGGSGGSTGGTSAGTAGSAGTSGGSAGSGGGAVDPLTYASELDGHVILLPCLQDTSERVCDTQPGAGCPNNDQDVVLDGAVTHNETITFGGDSNTVYDVTIRVQGQVEGKQYVSGATDQSQEPADGFVVGGLPDTARDDYNVYAMRVSDPEQVYYFNEIDVPGDLRIRHSTFDLDFEATVPIRGGATVQLIASDENCSAIKNCLDPDVGGVCNPHSVESLDPKISANLTHPNVTGTATQPYNGQFVGIVVQSVAPQ